MSNNDKRPFININWKQLAEVTGDFLHRMDSAGWGTYFQITTFILILSAVFFCIVIKIAPSIDPQYPFIAIIGLMALALLLTFLERRVGPKENYYNWPYVEARTLYRYTKDIQQTPTPEEERRHSGRRSLRLETLFETVDGKTQGLGYVLDASTRGIGFSCDCALEAGQFVQAFFRSVRRRSIIEIRWPQSAIMEQRLRNGAIVQA